jgi:hypothetical protein
VAIVCAISLFSAANVRAQAYGPAGAQFRANTYTTGDQNEPTAAIDILTTSYVFWSSSSQDTGTSAIYGQRYVAGVPAGAEFRVNTYTTGNQVHPVAAVGQGKYVVVWQDDGGHDGSGSGIYGQRYDGSGNAVGSEFLVNEWTTGNQVDPSVTSDGAGNFVVAWSGAGNGDADGIWARFFNSTGSPYSGDVRMNTYTTGVQSHPSVAMPVGGAFNYIVVWESAGQDGPTKSIYAQRYDAVAGYQDAQFRVNATTAVDQDQPVITTSANANAHAIVWRKATGDSSSDVVGRAYDAMRNPIGSEFTVNVSTGRNERPSVAMDGADNFVVAWTGYTGANPGRVLTRRYAAGLASVGAELPIAGQPGLSQTRPTIGGFREGQFRIAWSAPSNGQEVYTQLYCNAVAGDANGDHTITVADVFFLINNLFAGGPAPASSCDVNGDNKVDVSDVFYLINYLFAGGAAPRCVL